MNFAELKSMGWQIGLCRPCEVCQGNGHIDKSSFNNVSLNMGFYGSSTKTDSPCPKCLNGFIFAPLPVAEGASAFLEALIEFLEDPKNAALRKKYLDLHILDVEQRLGAPR
jgi:hypothetical protein